MISNQVREKIILSPELDELVNNLSLLNTLLCHFLVSYPALILQILAPAPCTVHPSSNTSCFHQCPWKNSVTPAGILLSGWKPSKSRMCSRNFARCQFCKEKEEFGLGVKYKIVQLTIPAGYVILPSGPAELCTMKELPAFISDRWFELHLEPQTSSLYNTFGELKFVCGSHDQVK